MDKVLGLLVSFAHFLYLGLINQGSVEAQDFLSFVETTLIARGTPVSPVGLFIRFRIWHVGNV